MVAKQLVAGIADFMHRCPTVMKPWTKQVFQLLDADYLRLYVTMVLTNLILSGVLQLKHGIGKLVYLLDDDDAKVSLLCVLAS
jgi:hypothetical protein